MSASVVDAPSVPAAALHQSDAELVRRARRGDLAAFEALYRAHVATVHGLARRMTRNQEDAEEAAQRAFVTAWERLADLEDDERFGAWLYRLTVNLVISELRTRARRPDAGEGALDALSAPRRTLEIGVDLERAIDSLPPQARRVFLLHDVEGYKHREIAGATGLATGTSKAHLHRARALLRRMLQ